MSKPNIGDFGVLLGGLLVFVSVFMPWFSVNIYGNTVTYTGIAMASSFSIMSIVYLLPLLSGILISYVIAKWLSNESHTSKKAIDITCISVAAAMLVVVFIALFMYPAGVPSSVLNGMNIGGYAAITGAITAQIFTIFHIS